MNVVELDFNYFPDVEQLKDEYQQLFFKFRNSHINLRKPSWMVDSVGVRYAAETMYNHREQRYDKDQSEFDSYCDFVSQYKQFNTLLREVEEYADRNLGIRIGRARLLTLRPKTNLTYHTDSESSIRLHVPIITNKNIFFIVDEKVERMPNEGSLYSLNVQLPHTVVNASREDRVHLVLDGYK